ncbi:hypothetical protein KC19_12G105100 [Ceratodon purpureus]|uniref:RecA family profile 1 domain-containing protein n=1 Tax=Ceratodon purpureus TaxID=3225 RepID=A0A8T0G702_CERPU|nr:hypothetical protein KC19_12G105100 [Ceratodon purpureus]
MPRLDTLGLPSLTPSVLASFAAHGILSVEDFLVSENTLKLDETRSEAQRQAILDLVDYLEQQSWGFRTTWRMRQELKARGQQYLPTGCESLDKLLEGGLREGTVTELVGGSSSGKTQVCMQVAANVSCGCRAMVGYVDTCHSFSATRLSHMLGGLVGGRDASQRRAGAADEIGEAMKSVLHYSIFDIFAMLSLLNQIHINLCAQVQVGEQPKTLRLLIVDCASSVIAPILGGTQGHALMVSMGIILKKLALENHLAVLITNHTVGGEGGQPKPALGETWKAIPNVRLHFVRDWDSNLCHVSVMKHATMSCNRQTAFRITRTGLKPAF